MPPERNPAPPSPTPHPASFVHLEAAALTTLANRLESTLLPAFQSAVDRILATDSRPVLLTGIGKSGIIARKIAATLRSTGSPAHFLHPAEAIHGDLGMLAPRDVLVALSYSGETEELLRLLPTLQRLQITLISLCACPASSLAQASAIVLDTSVDAEACPLNLAPTASTTVMLALGDALALTLSHRRNFTPQHFADLHPGGRLGRRLSRVRDLMHSGEALPAVTPATPMPQVIHEMSHKKLGMTTVLQDGQLRGMISDGDLRRLLERDGPNALAHTAAEIMNPTPITIDPDAFASNALARMEERKITALIVTSPTGHVEGVLHLHDLWTLEL